MEKKHIITLGGLPGGGKSTVRDLLAEKLNYKTFYTGGFTRKLAEKNGITLEEFNEKIAGDKSIDELIDTEQTRIGKEENNYIVDAHIGFYFIPQSFKVFLTLPIEESARRIFNDRDSVTRINVGDVMDSYEDALERVQKRIENHNKRYKKHYGIEAYKTSQFDLVVDTTEITPEQVTDKIVAEYKKWVQ